MTIAAPTTPVRFHPRRGLGRTGFRATQLGIGDLADHTLPIEQCVATALRALTAGLNLIDTAPGYETGLSEQIVGQAVRGAIGTGGTRREDIFVIDKIDHHDQPVAEQVRQSLARLELDAVDLLVFHGLSTPEAWQQVTAPGGGFEQLAACVRAGQTRFRGISSHNPEVLRIAIASGLCDVVMFPIGPYVDPRYVEEVLPLARQQQVGTVCFKTFGAGKLLSDTTGYNQPLKTRPRGKISSGGRSEETAAGPALPCLTVEQCLHYTMTIDPDVALLGLSFPNEQDAAFAAASRFQPLAPQTLAETRRQAVAAIRDKGPCWWNPDGK
jgi:aryl-alcohol dehydrogenase-like predicted oxidoreductase